MASPYTEPVPRIFVYGTLLRGASNHHRMAGAAFVGAALTLPAFDLYDLGWHPAVVPGSTAILGEVFEVGPELLRALDAFEEHPTWFRRTPLALADGSAAEIYLYVSPLPPDARRIDHGDWARHLRER